MKTIYKIIFGTPGATEKPKQTKILKLSEVYSKYNIN